MTSLPEDTAGTTPGTESAVVPVTVELTPQEVRMALMVGANRGVRAHELGRGARYGAVNGFDIHVQGAAAEMAVAKWRNLYWTDSPQLDYSGDVGPLHVRSTQHTDGGLLLHPGDPDDGIFVLVIGEIPVFRLAGWTLASEGKQERFWQANGLGGNGRPCFRVPQSELWSVEELRR